MQDTNRTFKLQDGSLFSLPRRVKRHSVTLLQKLTLVKDGRSNQGKRHPLPNILVLVFCGILAGCTNLTEIAEWGKAKPNRRFLKCVIDMPHGIPHPTTISYALQVCDIQSLVGAYLEWRNIIYGVITDHSASFDGKTMCGVHGIGVIGHILSLVSHETLTPLGQMGVHDKENEIPASYRLFDQVPDYFLVNCTLVGDALHTQTATVTAINNHHAYYLLTVKDNQEQLRRDLQRYFEESHDSYETASEFQHGHGRSIQTTVTISHATDMLAYLSSAWDGISTIGRISRLGTRTKRGIVTAVDETVYFIASTPHLTAKQALKFVRSHWKIENNLHWQKDYTYLEDRQTLRLGAAPQVVTFLKSMAINIFTLLKFASVTASVRTLKYNPDIHHDFLRMAAVV